MWNEVAHASLLTKIIPCQRCICTSLWSGCALRQSVSGEAPQRSSHTSKPAWVQGVPGPCSGSYGLVVGSPARIRNWTWWSVLNPSNLRYSFILMILRFVHVKMPWVLFWRRFIWLFYLNIASSFFLAWRRATVCYVPSLILNHPVWLIALLQTVLFSLHSLGT